MKECITLKEINDKFDIINEKSKYPVGNYYLLLVEKNFIIAYEDWFLLWGQMYEGYFEIAGNKVFVVQSPLNTIIDITEQMEK